MPQSDSGDFCQKATPEYWSDPNGTAVKPLLASPFNLSPTGIRHDEGKPRWDLIPPDAILEVVKVFSEGAKKYADRNWEKGMKWNKHFAAMQRHLWKWESGISLDEESGLNHLAHAAFGCLALLAYELRQIGEDDRPKLK